MKKNNGITIISLIIYILVMILVIGVIGTISTMFYNNTKELDNETKQLLEYNNFNSYFIKEIKTANNKVDKISEDGKYILFNTGNSFSLREDKILYNDIEIAQLVENINFQYYINELGEKDESVVAVEVHFKAFSKKINYKIEEIY